MCAGTHEFDPAAPIAWAEGYDLLEKEHCWVPAEIVHTDYTLPQPDGYFLAGSNGLASGNHLIEAVNAALYELVERDAVAVWITQPLKQRAFRVLDLASVDDPDCRTLLALYETAGINVRVWNVTTDIAIAAFLCEIRDVSAGDPQRPTRFHGSGCHADRSIALARALTEAAQTRLTYITGIRDDLSPAEYRTVPGDELRDALLDALAQESRADARSLTCRTSPPTISATICAGHWAGSRQPASTESIAVDLTRPEFMIPVVRLVIPGLEWDPHHPNYRPGHRAPSKAPVDEGGHLCRAVVAAASAARLASMTSNGARRFGQGSFIGRRSMRPAVIGVIDGYFEVTPTVWHKEILWAMAQGIHVFGAASIGALRAAELDAFGMKGIGRIYEDFRDGVLEDDDEVAVLHGPAELGYPPLTEAMVNIRATLAAAAREGIISA